MKNLLRAVLSLSLTLHLGCRSEPPAPEAPAAEAIADAAAPASTAPDTTREAAEPASPPADAADPSAPLPLWDMVRKERLDNGLTSYVMHHGHPKNRAYIWLALNVGSAQETDDERGLAHLVEHMAFSGTRRFEGSAIVKWAEGIGMRFGADVNAYTSFDATVYQLEIPTDDPAHLDKALDILRDWATDITFNDEALSRERGVVLEERRLRRGVGERIFNAHLPVLFQGSRYATRLPIGSPEVIEGAPRDTVIGFYKRWYRPDLMAVMVVGDLDADTAEAAIRKRFSDLTAPSDAPPRPDAGLPEPGLRVSVARDREMPRASLGFYELFPHRPEGTAGDYRRALAEGLWQIIMAERLGALSKRPDAPFEQAGFGIDSPMRELDALAGQVLPKPGKLLESFEALLRERRRAELHGFTPDEIERARAQLRRFYEDYDLGFDTTESHLFIDEMTRNFFEGELMIGATREKALAMHYLDALTSDEIAAAGRAFAASERKVVMVSAPEDEALPDTAAIEAIFAKVEADTSLVAPVAPDSLGPLVADAPSGGRIVARRTLEALGVTEWKLDNGLTVLVKPTDFEIDKVVITASGPGGYATVPDAEWESARYAMAALSQGGVGAHDLVTLGKLLAGKDTDADTFAGDTTEGVAAGGSVRDLETIFQLLWLSVTAPRVDKEAVAIWQEAYATELEAERRNPERRFAIELSEAMGDGHPRAKWPTADGVRAIDLEAALALHRARFGDVSDWTFAIVGAVELETLEPLVEKWLGALPGGGRTETERDTGVRMPGGVVEKTWRLGQEDKASVQVWLHQDALWDRDADRDLRILADALAIRLREVLREDLGGVYGVQVRGSFSRRPVERHVLSLSFGCAPGRVDELLKAAFAEIDRIAEEGVGDEVLSSLRQMALRSREVQLRDNGVWAAWLLACARFGDDPALILDPEPHLARLKDDHVKAAARRFGDRKQMFKAVLLPAEK